MNEIWLSWLAGFFDGEGSIGLWSAGKRKNGERYRTIKLSISQNNEEIIKEIYEMYPEGYICSSVTKSNNTNWVFRISGNSACERFVRDILPYTKVKTEKLKSCLEYIEKAKENQRHFGMYRDKLGRFIEGHNSYAKGVK